MTTQALTVDEVANRLNVRPRTVYRLIQKGKLRGVKVGRLWRVPEFAFQSFLEGESEECDNEPLTPEDWAVIEEGRESVRRGEFITLEEHKRKHGV